MVDYTGNMTVTDDKVRVGGWRAAILWGVGTALLHRVLLMAWLAGIWSVVGSMLPPDVGASVDFHNTANLPSLTTQADQLLFGVWRRWDAVHYLDLATNGYRVEHPGPTVFGVLTPLGIRAFDLLLPGGIDFGSLVFQTLAFALALTLLYRVVEVYYGDAGLAPWAVAVVALLPLSYFFAAPMSESIYLAMVMGVFFFGAKEKWGLVALCGLLATLARSQGVLLLGVAGLLMLEKYPPTRVNRDYVLMLVRRGWLLLLIPLGFVGFELYRAALGLPPVSEIYRTISFNYFTNPIDGLITNLRWFMENPSVAFTSIDLMALLITLILVVILIRARRHRRPALIAYTVGFMLLFVSRINYFYGTDNVMFTQSYGRYALVLFPLAILLADGMRSTTFWGRIIGAAVLILLLSGFSALYVLALSGP